MASKRKQKSMANTSPLGISAGNWAFLVLLTLFIVVAPFQFGFFNGTGLHSIVQFNFEKPVVYSIIFGMIGMIVVGILLISRGGVEHRHLLALAGAALPLFYWISSFNADSHYLSQISVLLNMTFYAFFLMGILLADNKKAIILFQNTFVIVGYAVVIYGLMILFGNVFVTDGLSFDIGIRLASVFTYSNANAAFLIVLLMGSFVRLTSMRRTVEQNVHIFMLVPIVSSLMMTLSRGAMIMLPIIVLVAFFMFGIRRQIALLGYMSLSMVLSLLILPDLTDRGTRTYERFQSMINAGQPVHTIGLFSDNALGGWVRIIVAGLIMVGVVYVVQKYAIPRVNKYQVSWFDRKGSRLYIPVAMVLLSFVGFGLLVSGLLSTLLPKGVAGRIDNFSLQTHSVLERLTIYKNALQLWKEHPLLGGGGGAWEARYDRFQSYPYSSAQTHSYPIQLLTDIGLIGLIVIVTLVLYVIIRYLCKYFRQKESEQNHILFFFLMTISFLLHSCIDFEMSYAYMGGMAFLGLGVLAGTHTEKSTWIGSQRREIGFRRAMGGVLVVVALIGLYSAIGMLSVFGYYQKSVDAAARRESLTAILSPLKTGLTREPRNPFVLDRMISYNVQAFKQSGQGQFLQAAKGYLASLSTAEPFFKNLIIRQYDIAINEGDSEKAVQNLDRAVQSSPFELAYYEQDIMDRFKLWQEYRQLGDEAKAKTQGEAVLAMTAKVQNRVKQLVSLPKVIIYSRKFEVTTNMYLSAGQVYFFNHRYEEATHLLKPALTGKLDTDANRRLALFYLASMQKLGKDDPQLRGNLVAADPKMVDQLRELATAK